jgi:integrase
MTLAEVVDQYIAWRQARGAHFRSGASVLRLYCQSVGGEVDCDAVGTEPARVFLAGTGPLTRYRANKRTVLAGFYRYAISRGHATHSPLPADEPKEPSSAPPYIYSRDELRRLLAAVDGCRKQAVQLQADTFRTLLLLLYGTGLRPGEALQLTLADIDLPTRLLTVHDGKFSQTRLVPLGPQLARALEAYAARCATSGTPLVHGTLNGAFAQLRCAADVRGAQAARHQPRLHDLRHTFAVHRLIAWYRQGADLQRMLPLLSVYLGHASLAGTQVYLSMTPELLHEAALRFERYAGTAEGGAHD